MNVFMCFFLGITAIFTASVEGWSWKAVKTKERIENLCWSQQNAKRMVSVTAQFPSSSLHMCAGAEEHVCWYTWVYAV